MGCFLGCFGGAKESRRRKHRINRASPQRQRNRVQNFHQEKTITEQQPVVETTIPIPTLTLTLTPTPTPTPTPTELVPELRAKPEVVEQLSASPKKRVTFNSNITTYEHVSVHESIESLPERLLNDEEKQDNLNTSKSHSHSRSEDENSITSSVASYPPNHRYHNARESDDEGEEYGDSDLDNLDDDEDDYSDYDDEEDNDIDARISSHKVWTESVVTSSMESTTANPSPKGITQEVESLPYGEIGPKSNNARDRSGYVNSVLNPVENITQWKAVKSKSKLPTQKENFEVEAPFSFKTKSKKANQEIAVDASLSNWLASPEIKKTAAASEGCTTPVRSFEDRPILGALTVEELRQMSASTASPRKSPSRSPDEMPIIGSVGSYWNNHSSSAKRSSFKGIPNTTSKYREDKRVNWRSTPFETRLDRALNRGD